MGDITVKLFKYLKYHLVPVYVHKVKVGSQWMVGDKASCEQERNNLIECCYHPNEVVVSIKVTTQAMLDKMPEHDGF